MYLTVGFLQIPRNPTTFKIFIWLDSVQQFPKIIGDSATVREIVKLRMSCFFRNF